VALRVEIRGTKDGGSRAIRFDLLDYYDESTGITAMMRTTGYSLALTGVMQGRGQIRELGVRTPDETVDPDAYLDGLARRGIQIQKSEVSGVA
jgi:lysine 6-dehydrogenase